MNIDSVLQTKGRRVITTTPETPLPDLCQKMRIHGVGALVVSRDGARLDGIVSERDVVLAIAQHGAPALRMTVGQVMTKAPLTLTSADTIKHAMTVMTDHRVRHLPVVDDGRLAGMISIGDIVKNRLEEVELETHVLRDVYLAGH
jgi:CBS domain-containing protein